MIKKILHYLSPIIGIFLFIIALLVLHNELREYHFHDVLNHLRDLSAQRILTAFLLTILSYVTLTGYDTLAFRYINHPLNYSKIAFTSFISYALSLNVGQAPISGGSVRYRLYSAWGLSIEEIAKVIAFCIFTSLLGIFTFGGLVFLIEPLQIPVSLHIPFTSVRPIGIIFLIVVSLYLIFSLLGKKSVQIKKLIIPIPSIKLSFAQIILTSLDWTMAGSVLYALIPTMQGISFFYFLSIFLLAQLAGVVSQVPGGLGVFETVILLLLSPQIPASEALVSLLAFRFIYYLVPLFISAVLLGTYEILEKGAYVKKLVQNFGQFINILVPNIMAVTTFIGGIILLFSGATPSLRHRLALIKDFLPLPIMEISHFLGSIAGVSLLLLARGIQRRLDGAYILTIIALIAGIVLSLFKGFDYEEAIILSIMLMALIPCRRQFYRRASLMNQSFSFGWITAIIMVLLTSVWLGLFSYKHIEFTNELWWQFTLHGNASRFLRATVGSFSFVLIFAIARLLRPIPPKPALPTIEELQKIRPIVDASRKTAANLVFLGDKSIIMSQNEKAFIMYGVEGRSWVSMGDPIGLKEEFPELVWKFREMCDHYNGWTIFYEVGQDNLPIYLDMGLTFFKLGEEARVRLDTFSIEGGERKGLRHTYNKLEKEGCVFEIIPTEDVPKYLTEFKFISDAWLTEKHTQEKGFSLGFFYEKYLKNFSAGVIKQQGKIIAFTNIWMGAEKEELSVDLMRYLHNAPQSVMEYLFIKLMLWGNQEGYKWFNMGMAPFSGFENRPLTPLWNRIGAFIFRYGEHFYNFHGLRQYKEKFNPEWESKYIASPGGMAFPRILTNISSLISGSLKSVITK